MINEYFNKNKVTLQKINKQLANEIVEKFHYSHSKTKNKISFGIYYESENKFFDDGKKLIGVIIYAHPIGRLVVKSIAETLEDENVLELVRLFIHDGYGKNIESYCISQSIKYIKKHHPEVEVLISYADPEQGHVGTIYQAGNWRYQGTKSRIVDAYWYKFPNKDEWLHPRTIVNTYGSCTPEVLLTKFPTYRIKELMRKHRYLYILKDIPRILGSLKYPTIPYPEQGNEEPEEIFEISKKKNEIITKKIDF